MASVLILDKVLPVSFLSSILDNLFNSYFRKDTKSELESISTYNF